MDAATQRITEGLKKAIDGETAGHHFYLMAARSTSDEKGRAVFEALAEEELEHVRFLKAQYRAFLEGGAPDRSIRLGRGSAFKSGSPIFSDRLRDRIGEAHFEMSALSIGMELEQNAVRFYSAQAEEAEDPAVKEFYQELVRWEQGHFDMRRSQQEALREEYWAGGGFSPF